MMRAARKVLQYGPGTEERRRSERERAGTDSSAFKHTCINRHVHTYGQGEEEGEEEKRRRENKKKLKDVLTADAWSSASLIFC
jgi:hypothetical protein